MYYVSGDAKYFFLCRCKKKKQNPFHSEPNIT